MANALKYAAAPAHTLGMSLEELSAAVAIMSDAGIRGETAGTTLRMALTRLAKPTDEALKGAR
jgi:TP901 family phage tail tape measure protein